MDVAPRAGLRPFDTRSDFGAVRHGNLPLDMLLQKTFVVDPITKEVRKNNGEKPQYFDSEIAR